MLGCKPIDTLIEPNHKLDEANIAYVVSVISQFMHSPKDVHFQVAYRVLRYLKSTPGKGILFKKGVELSLEASLDANSVGLIVDRRSTLGHCTLLGGNLVT
ncbi:hypothetical protein AAG906_017337 [Vitis piasezkii]